MNNPDGVPEFTVTIECPTTVKLGGTSTLQVKALYKGLRDGSKEAKPIIFHRWMFWTSFVLQLQRRSRDGDGKWIEYELEQDNITGFQIIEKPPQLVNITTHRDFTTLSCGEEAVVDDRRFHDPTWDDLPEDTQVGDAFRLRFKGTEIEWWIWGTRQDHANTEVYLPCWNAGPVMAPENPNIPSDHCPKSDNGGRPKLKVSSSDWVYFYMIK